jgi:1-acyl-sn-glycerol-3-phosphate acyltransferase
MAGETWKLTNEIREVAKGWRWGHRPVVPRSAQPHTPPPKPWSFPTDWARTEAAGAVRDMVLDLGLRPIIWSETSPEVFGRDNLDGVKAPVMFIANHTSHLDASIIMTTLPKKWRDKTATAAAKDYFFDVWWRSAFTALVYAGFPVERGGGERATHKAKELIRDGWSIVVFPEGTRSPDGWVQRFRHGAARLALDMDMPVVPIAIVGAYAAMPRGRSWPKPGRPPIRVYYGRPLHPREGESHQELSLRMQHALAELFDEDRTSWWEAQQRAARNETPKLTGPAGPQWLRTWEGSRPIQRRGKPPTWK